MIDLTLACSTSAKRRMQTRFPFYVDILLELLLGFTYWMFPRYFPGRSRRRYFEPVDSSQRKLAVDE